MKHLFAAATALALAEDWDTARFAASRVKVEYEGEPSITDLDAQRVTAFAVKKPENPRGDAASAIEAADVQARGGIFHSDRAPQSDGAVCDHGSVGRPRQADRVRQDAGRAERPALRRQCVQQEARRRARDVAVHGWRISAPAFDRNIRWCWRFSARWLCNGQFASSSRVSRCTAWAIVRRP